MASHTCRAAIIHYEGLLGDRYGEGIPQATRRRGLARSGVPVAVDADVPRLSEHVEQAAYFVASEALTNLNKHSGAHSAELGAVIETEQLRLWIADDGVGGASLAKGHGLAGLVERLEGVDGRLTVTSPAGGPTRVEAVIPCAS